MTGLAQWIPAPVNKFIVELLGKKCYKRLIQDFNIFDVSPASQQCLKLALSKVLGLGIVVGGGVVKLPQIAKILSAQSAQGLSLLACFLETAAYSVTLAYNVRHENPFSTYGETAFVTLQNLFILFLILHYSGRSLVGFLLVAILFGTSWVLYNPLWVDSSLLAKLQMLTVPFGVISKLPQIWSNFDQGHTGQLSAFTVTMYFLGSTARVFTTMQEVNDPLILCGFLLASVFNTVLLAQLILFWNKTKIALASKADKKKK